MRLLIVIGMVIIFVSAFFILLTVDSIVRDDMNCVSIAGGKTFCNVENIGLSFIVKLLIIGFFIVVDIVTFYLIVTNVMPNVYYVRRGEREW